MKKKKDTEEKKLFIIPDGIYLEKDHVLTVISSIKKQFKGNSDKVIAKAKEYFYNKHPKERRK